MMIHLTKKSSNVKTGPIPVSTSSAATCPDSCPFKAGGCYAKSGPLMIHWKHVTEGRRGLSLDDFLAEVRSFDANQIWRHNQAGDLFGDNESIDVEALSKLVEANRGRRGFTYTHKPLTEENSAAIRHANDNGFTINVSADSLSDADKAVEANVGPVCVVVPEDSENKGVTKNGNRWVVCPAQQKEGVSCATCQLCQRQRSVIVAFKAHGTGKKKVNAIVSQ